MWKLILWYSLLGGLLLILSRIFGVRLYYMGGYLFLITYVVTVVLVIITGKRMNIDFMFSDYFKLVMGVFLGMTLLYFLFILIRNNFLH